MIWVLVISKKFFVASPAGIQVIELQARYFVADE